MTDERIIAVAGATGAQGGGLVRAILSDGGGGFRARALTRDANSDKAKELARLGAEVVVMTEAIVIRRINTPNGLFFGFQIDDPDEHEWRRTIESMETHHNATGALSGTSEVADASEEWSVHDMTVV